MTNNSITINGTTCERVENVEVKVKYLIPEQVTEMIFGKYNLIPKKE